MSAPSLWETQRLRGLRVLQEDTGCVGGALSLRVSAPSEGVGVPPLRVSREPRPDQLAAPPRAGPPGSLGPGSPAPQPFHLDQGRPSHAPSKQEPDKPAPTNPRGHRIHLPSDSAACPREAVRWERDCERACVGAMHPAPKKCLLTSSPPGPQNVEIRSHRRD